MAGDGDMSSLSSSAMLLSADVTQWCKLEPVNVCSSARAMSNIVCHLCIYVHWTDRSLETGASFTNMD